MLAGLSAPILYWICLKIVDLPEAVTPSMIQPCMARSARYWIPRAGYSAASAAAAGGASISRPKPSTGSVNPSR